VTSCPARCRTGRWLDQRLPRHLASWPTARVEYRRVRKQPTMRISATSRRRTLMPGGTGRTIIRAARLIDGTGAAPQTDVALVVDGTKIASVEPWREELRQGATVYEFPVETVMPGLVDAHCHLSLLGAGQARHDRLDGELVH